MTVLAALHAIFNVYLGNISDPLRSSDTFWFEHSTAQKTLLLCAILPFTKDVLSVC